MSGLRQMRQCLGPGQCRLWPCEKFHFRSSVESFEYSMKFSIVVGSICHCAGQQIPPTYDHNDHHDAHSLRRVKGCHNALRIEDVEMVTTETD